MEDTQGTALKFPEQFPSDPLQLFREWFSAGERLSGLKDPNAICLSTIDEDGYPDARVVLLKSYDERGFVFFTNTLSRKGRSLGRQPKAAMTLYWDALQRQIRIQGDVEKVSEAEAEEYFRSRPRISQVGAWASMQSEALPSREILEGRVQDYNRRFEGQDVPRPPHWSGYRVRPRRIEFWQDRPNRLHDRIMYVSEKGLWEHKRLYP